MCAASMLCGMCFGIPKADLLHAMHNETQAPLQDQPANFLCCFVGRNQQQVEVFDQPDAEKMTSMHKYDCDSLLKRVC